MPDNKDLPAYPQPLVLNENNKVITPDAKYKGLSKRETIAAMCLQGLLTHKWYVEDTLPRDLAKIATERADALLTHLQNTEQ
jgi:hypothetical protein